MYTVKHAGGGRRARRSTTPVACPGEVRIGRHRADA
jgi:hypothetical protein